MVDETNGVDDVSPESCVPVDEILPQIDLVMGAANFADPVLVACRGR